MMKGIDISRWNGYPFNAATAAAYAQCEFVIVKATQGTSYGYTGTFKKQIDKVLADGKLGGAYHYAAGGNPESEAAYFVSIVKPYLGKIILVLDWERGQNPAYGSTTWAKRFIDRVKALTSVQCFLYAGSEGTKQCRTCYPDAPLWFAGYPVNAASWNVPAFPARYSPSPWPTYNIWQFTSGGGVDRNTTAMTREDWQKLAAGVKVQTVQIAKPVSQPTTDVLTLVYNTMLGKYGSGAKRKAALGARYTEVQSVINHIASASISVLMQETLAGKYGNGNVRKVVLGKKYRAVQDLINRSYK